MAVLRAPAEQRPPYHLLLFTRVLAFQKKGGDENKMNKQRVAQGRCETGEVDKGELN
jgi:hypothetical protein